MKYWVSNQKWWYKLGFKLCAKRGALSNTVQPNIYGPYWLTDESIDDVPTVHHGKDLSPNLPVNGFPPGLGQNLIVQQVERYEIPFDLYLNQKL